MTTLDAGVEPADELVAALTALRQCVAATAFDLATIEQADRRHLRDRVAGDIAGHIARIRDIDAPLLVVLGGVTGAGKSTFLNTMVGRDVVATGPVRPTTYAPTLVCHPTEADWFTSDRVLAELARVETDSDVRDVGPTGASVLRLLRSGTVPPGLALVDAPDVDSVASANRELADQLLDAADLWLWFTTGGKYADEESMRYLRRARARRTALGVVLTQVHRIDLPEVRADFIGKLADEGLPNARLFTIHVTAVRAGRLPVGVGDELRTWLRRLADPEVRRAHRRQTLEGGLDAVPDDVGQLIDAVGDELHQVRRLQVDVDHAYDGAEEEFAASLDEGMPLRGEVVDRWDRFVGGSRVLKLTEAATGQARAWIRGLLANAGLIGEERRLEQQVRVEVAGTVTATAGQLADLAATTVVDAWSATPAGRTLTEREPELVHRSAEFDERMASAVRDWQQHVANLVASVGAERRAQARVVSGIVSLAATSAILLAMAHAGITGAEAGIAAAAGAANQGLLVKLLGEANLRKLVADARADLLQRFNDLLADERRRFVAVVAEVAPDPEHLDELADAGEALMAVRGG